MPALSIWLTFSPLLLLFLLWQELKDALDTLGLSGEDAGLTSCTFPEFALLCSHVLEGDKDHPVPHPVRFLGEALQIIFDRAVSTWSRAAVAQAIE